MGDRESGIIVVGDCRVDLVRFGGVMVGIVWLVGVWHEVSWWPWIRGGGVSRHEGNGAGIAHRDLSGALYWIGGGGVCSSGGVSRHEGSGAGIAHRDSSGVLQVFGGVVVEVSGSGGWFAGAAQSSAARGVSLGVSMVVVEVMVVGVA